MRTAKVLFAARSDKGRVRRNNEDNLFLCGGFLTEENRELPFKSIGRTEAPAVFAVFDGMGGEASGERASLTAAKTLAAFHDRLCCADRALLDNTVEEFVCEVNRRIRMESVEFKDRAGTTMALVAIGQREIYAYNIGDSRIYLYQKGKFSQLSVDHTLAMRKAAAGIYTLQEARCSDDWGKLTACLGIAGAGGTDFKAERLPSVPIVQKTRLLLCSDGVTDMLPDEDIRRLIHPFKAPELAAKDLMSEALNRGGRDNISLIVLDIRP